MDDQDFLEGLRKELDSDGPDSLWLEIVTGVVCRHERIRADEAGDLVQDLFLERLLVNGRARYIAENATNLRHVENLIAQQLKQLKSNQRERGGAERVTNRVVDLLKGRLRSFGEHSSAGFGDPTKARPLSAEDVDNGARVVLRWRRLPDEGDVRASRIFDTEVLENGLGDLLVVLGTDFYSSDIYGIFFRAFTAVGLTRFMANRGLEDQKSAALTPYEAQIVEETVAQLERSLSSDQLKVICLWMTHDTQEARARELGISRPTLLKRQEEARAVASSVLKDLPHPMGELAVQEVVGRNRYI